MSDDLREAIERAATKTAITKVHRQLMLKAFTAELAPLFEHQARTTEHVIAMLKRTTDGYTALVEQQNKRIAELESLLREARHDLHYLIRCVTSESTTDMGFTEHAKMRFASEIETIEKIDAATRMAAQLGDEG